MAKRKPSLSSTLLRFVIGIPTLFNVVRKTFALIKIEARESGKSLMRIILLSVFSLMILSSTWFCALGLLFFYLLQWHWSIPGALLLIFSGNVLILLVLLLFIKKLQKKLCFPETRSLLKSL
jgi:hypothetical protein